MKPECLVEGCKTTSHSRGFCNHHYYKWKTYGTPLGKSKKKPARKCEVAGCDRPHYGKGWCSKHYKQVKELGYDEPVPDTKLCKECNKPFERAYVSAVFCSNACRMRDARKHGCYTDDEVIRRRGLCSHDGCENGVHAHGYCRKHASRLWRHGDPTGGLPEEAPICSREGCDKAGGRKSGLCPTHNANAYYYANHDREKSRHNERRSRVRKATPPWVDKREMLQIYLDCPTGYEVDHMHPIRGKGFCGLHVPWNLQYLPEAVNRKKSNRLHRRYFHPALGAQQVVWSGKS